MKKGIFILLGMFMMVSTVEAENNRNFPDRFGFDYSYNNAVNFFERGIEFFVFTNGDFDFDTSYNNNRVRINRDFRGQIRSVGNVFINYDRIGNVTRIGNIFIRYRRGRLTRVGNLRVDYDRWNSPIFRGNVNDFYYHNGVRFSINFGDIFGYNDSFFFRNSFRNNYSQFREDRNFYYYKARPNANIGKRSKIIRRRKAAVANNDRNIRRNSNNVRSTVRNNSRSTLRNGKSIKSYRKPVVKHNDRNVKRNSNSRTSTRNTETTKRSNQRKVDLSKKSDHKKRNGRRSN